MTLPVLTGDQLELYLALDPIMRGAFNLHAAEYHKRFPNRPALGLTSTRRSRAEQEHLHESNPRRAAPPGRSKHEIGMAYDFHGPETDAEWDAAGRIAERLGLRWGGRWRTPERWHVELRATRSQLLAMQRASVAGGALLLAGLLLVKRSS